MPFVAYKYSKSKYIGINPILTPLHAKKVPDKNAERVHLSELTWCSAPSCLKTDALDYTETSADTFYYRKARSQFALKALCARRSLMRNKTFNATAPPGPRLNTEATGAATAVVSFNIARQMHARRYFIHSQYSPSLFMHSLLAADRYY